MAHYDDQRHAFDHTGFENLEEGPHDQELLSGPYYHVNYGQYTGDGNISNENMNQIAFSHGNQATPLHLEQQQRLVAQQPQEQLRFARSQHQQFQPNSHFNNGQHGQQAEHYQQFQPLESLNIGHYGQQVARQTYQQQLASYHHELPDPNLDPNLEHRVQPRKGRRATKEDSDPDYIPDISDHNDSDIDNEDLEEIGHQTAQSTGATNIPSNAQDQSNSYENEITEDPTRLTDKGKLMCLDCRTPASKKSSTQRCGRCQKKHDKSRAPPPEIPFHPFSFEDAHYLVHRKNATKLIVDEEQNERDMVELAKPGLREQWLEQFINAMNLPYALTAAETIWTPDKHKNFTTNQVRFNRKFYDQPAQYNAENINARCALLFETVRRAHTPGSDWYFASGGDNGGYAEEGETLSVFGRLTRIVELMTLDKRITMDVIESRGVNALVASPEAYAKRKEDNVSSNFRKAKEKAAKEAKELAEAIARGEVDANEAASKKRKFEFYNTAVDANVEKQFHNLIPPPPRHPKGKRSGTKNKVTQLMQKQAVTRSTRASARIADQTASMGQGQTDSSSAFTSSALNSRPDTAAQSEVIDHPMPDYFDPRLVASTQTHALNDGAQSQVPSFANNTPHIDLPAQYHAQNAQHEQPVFGMDNFSDQFNTNQPAEFSSILDDTSIDWNTYLPQSDADKQP